MSCGGDSVPTQSLPLNKQKKASARGSDTQIRRKKCSSVSGTPPSCAWPRVTRRGFEMCEFCVEVFVVSSMCLCGRPHPRPGMRGGGRGVEGMEQKGRRGRVEHGKSTTTFTGHMLTPHLCVPPHPAGYLRTRGLVGGTGRLIYISGWLELVCWYMSVLCDSFMHVTKVLWFIDKTHRISLH